MAGPLKLIYDYPARDQEVDSMGSGIVQATRGGDQPNQAALALLALTKESDIARLWDDPWQARSQPQDEPVVATWDDHIHVARSQPRDPKTGAICFDVTYADGSWSRVPVQAFVDPQDNLFTHEVVADAVNDWVAMAKRCPFVRRNCLCCSARAFKGGVLCGGCNRVWGPAIYA